MPDQMPKNEEVRKLQFSGRSSYTLALPKKWVSEMKLEAGDTVSITKQGDSTLLISPRGGKTSGTKAEAVMEISPKNKVDSTIRRLISLYLLGYSIIQLRAKDGSLNAAQREAIKEAVRRHLIGTEVIADSREGTTFQVLLSYPELSVKNVLKRMFLITASMHRDAVRALGKLDKDLATGVTKSDDEVDRFSLYAIRQLNMAAQNDLILKEVGLKTRRDCLDYRLMVKSVERVADHANKMASSTLGLDSPLSQVLQERVLKMSEFAIGLFEESGLALFKEDYDAADRIVEQAELAAKMQDDLLKMIEKGKERDADEALSLIVEDIRRTAEYAGDIAEIVINMITENAITRDEKALIQAA